MAKRTLSHPTKLEIVFGQVLGLRKRLWCRPSLLRGRGRAHGVMFLRHKICRKDGKEHRAWSVVENRRVHDGRVVQRQVLYLGEINDSQRAAWCQTIEAFDEGRASQTDRVVSRGSSRRSWIAMCCRSGSAACACVGRGNGVPAGWRVFCGISWVE